MTLRSLIVDDNGHFLGAARDLLQRQGIDVVGVASTGDEAAQLTQELKPDVTLLDIDLGDESGFDVARRLAEASGGALSPVILISTYAEKDFADLIADSPAVGFVSKSDLSARSIYTVLETTGTAEIDPG
jgi:DNA-binding NarL/FixJ family response regulator